MDMGSIKNKLRQMALTPRSQLRRLAIGTVGAIVCMMLLFITSEHENLFVFYGLSTAIAFCVIYAIPGYIGIWVWRMRKSFFDLD